MPPAPSPLPTRRRTHLAVLLAALALPAFAPAATDVLAGSGFARDPIGRLPSRPWQPSKPTPMGAAVRDALPGASDQAWVKIIDGEAEASTSLRHPLPNVREGKLIFRLVNARQGGAIGFYIGTGAGSSPDERIFELKISGSGSVAIGSRGERSNTGFKVDLGVEYELYLEFGPEEGGGGSLAFGYIRDGSPVTVATTNIARADTCTILRITTDRSNADTMFFISDVRLEVP